MPLTKPRQNLHHDLKTAALNLELACANLGRIANRLSGPEVLELMQVIKGLYEEVDRLTALLASDIEEDACRSPSPTSSCNET